ncbi:MAG TPA: crossover junction endodeoxyribonuclease RuvC [Actinomycetota bacterium]|jgi:crossover junction endodeoxyribonuclease RuvC|nr:crossover junction endodeoxyribonuclease RuvC [Actinomycetota bacterium]
MRVLGLDPGLTSAGFGLVEETGGTTRAIAYGAIRTARGPVPQRLAALYDEVKALMSVHRPHAVAVERVLFNANTRTAMSVGQAAGVALLAAAQFGCEVAEYTPGEVKLAVTAAGNADKRQMQQMIGRLLTIDPPKPADAADALGLALTHLRSRKLRRLQEAARA